jgi:hypothetical protein
MKEKSFAVVGSFSMAPPYSHGLSVYNYDKRNGSLDFIGRFFEDINVGQQYYSTKHNVLYINNEIRGKRGKTGGGGYLTALSVNQATGELHLINEKETLCPMPSWLIWTGQAILPWFPILEQIILLQNVFVTKTAILNQKRNSTIFFSLFFVSKKMAVSGICAILIYTRERTFRIFI